ncbi:leucine-rich repeat and coiled-coil domain-containing protein 1 isoform X1 [Paramormyrops kingsleyae]|uniref:leucine-rich repeat and coiled-coil domain-containing protein 1 isoform X1 n=1 Tax=Paramormyrops kingsleyae TaxID=1676925 RepID=UPI000CD61530|nr:leucine-rich repeat and coiled-coil domain-containing protein 1 isoform X1 [Paramormyrops kingsleyae]XP_023671946.1 leucine-rich repeat and coiled-coil domain-containing protein 1 isoform X1 [Paramormyrops kingsleyae]
MADGELSLIDKNIRSLLEIPLSSKVRSLNLHCNRISKIEGLTSAWHIRQLDLSSNQISRIQGLCSLTSLQSLNLSCNVISRVEGLQGLVNLVKLDLSYNQIGDLSGLLHLHGTQYKLKHLRLQSNHVSSMSQVLQCLLGLPSLSSVAFSADGSGNPVCDVPGYRDLILQSLPQLSSLDAVDRQGNPSPCLEECAVDIPGMEDFSEFLLSDSSIADERAGADAPQLTPSVDDTLTSLRQRMGILGATGVRECTPCGPRSTGPGICRPQVSQLFPETPSTSTSTPTLVCKPRRDTDHTSDSECDNREESCPKGGGQKSRVPAGRKGPVAPRKKNSGELKGQRSHSTSESAVSDSKSATSSGKKAPPCSSSQRVETGRAERAGLKDAECLPEEREEESFRVVVEERDQERERRWKAEQAVRKLTEQLSSLERKAGQERDIQSMALHTSDRLKEVLLKERAARVELQQQVEELRQELAQAHGREDRQQGALRSLQDTAARDEALRAQQRADEARRTQELENTVSALKRELEILRASARQHKDKLQQLHELLTSREQEHRKELEARLIPGGPEFQEAVSRAVAPVERGHAQQLADLREKVNGAQARYGELEDEFRAALTIEAGRFSEVKTALELQAAELVECRAKLSRCQQRERESGALVQELTSMVKEQKARIGELVRSKREVVTELKVGGAVCVWHIKEPPSVCVCVWGGGNRFSKRRCFCIVRFLPSAVTFASKEAQKVTPTPFTLSGECGQERAAIVSARLRSLEATAEEDKRQAVQVELLKQEKSKLLSQLAAQESVIEGLRAERKLWGQELAQQGASLAQDRGRFEARIEVLNAELQSLKKQSESDCTSLRIKAKIVDDQTETIRKLKEGLQERDEQTRRLREETLQAQRQFEARLEEETAPLREQKEHLDQLSSRKEELELLLEDREAELEEVKREHSTMNRKWQDKAELLTRLESQVRRMKENFDIKEKVLMEEKERAQQEHRAAVEKLHSMDDAFRRQMEALQVSHQAELLQLAGDKQKDVELARQRVLQVEEEMRQLLEETESRRRTMDEKMRLLTSVLKDF